MPASRLVGAKKMLSGLDMAQTAMDRLDDLLELTRVQVAIQQRGKDSDEANHYRWYTGELNTTGINGLASCQVRFGKEVGGGGLLITRVAITRLNGTNASSGYVSMDTTGAKDMVETFTMSALNDGQGSYGYADAFSNFIYVAARRSFFINTMVDASDTQLVVKVQARRLVTSAERGVPDVSLQGSTPVFTTGRDAPWPGVDDDEMEQVLPRHGTPVIYSEQGRPNMPSDEPPGPEHTAEVLPPTNPQEIDPDRGDLPPGVHHAAQGTILPNIADRLPAHLRGLV